MLTAEEAGIEFNISPEIRCHFAKTILHLYSLEQSYTDQSIHFHPTSDKNNNNTIIKKYWNLMKWGFADDILPMSSLSEFCCKQLDFFH